MDKVDLGFLTAEEYVSRRSDTLSNNPDAKLSEQVEIKEYLSKLDNKYFDEIKSLSKSKTQPLSKKTKAIITIVAYEEGSKIKKTLEKYLNQDISFTEFEIIILDNHPETVEKDNTVDEVKKFVEENSSVHVVYIHKTWGKDDYATVGNARKYIFDIALFRILERGYWNQETILISNDADTCGFDKNYLSAILEEFNFNDSVDALVTLSVVPINVISKPNIYAVLSLWDALDEEVARNEPHNLIGRSSAYRASIYSAVGGYNPKGKLAGDLETGWLIADSRNWDPNSVIQLKKTKHIQDPRRILQAAASRVPVNEMYFDFVSKPEIRKADNGTLLSFIPDQLDWELFEEDADSFWQGRTTGMYRWRGERFKSDFNNAMNTIGAEYSIVNNRVKIKDLDNLLGNYYNDFGKTIDTFHSKTRKWNQKRQDDMKDFFFSISEGIIAARKKRAREISKNIEKASADKKEKLLREYKRFAGESYKE